MTSNVELLPLPEKVEVDKHLPTGVRIYAYDENTLKDYARANVEARAERLAEALRPLAELDLTADAFDQRPDSQPIYARNNTVITVGDVRKARAALHPTAAQEDGRY